MHRKENCSIPRIDLLDQSRFYIQHAKKMKKMKPSVNTSSIEPVNHFSIAHKEKEREWEYADSISKMCYSQIQSSQNQHRNKRSISNLSTYRRNASVSSTDIYPKMSNKNISPKPQFNLRTNIFPSSPKGGIYNYSSSFDSSSLSASGMLSTYISPKTQIEEDGSVASASTSIFLTQQKKKNYEKYQYSSLDNPKLRDRIQNDPFEILIKDGMKFVEFPGKTKNNASNSNDNLALRLNSKFRKSFLIGPADSSLNSNNQKPKLKSKAESPELYMDECDLQFDFHSNSNMNHNKKIIKNKTGSNKKNKKSKKSQLINSFEHPYQVEIDQGRNHKRFVKLKILRSLSYEFPSPEYPLSIKWADQKDLLSQDEINKNTNDNLISKEEIVGCYANPIVETDLSDPNTTRTAVNFSLDSDEDTQIVLEQSPLEFFESFELEISSQQHVLDISLYDESLNDSGKQEKNTENKEQVFKEEMNSNDAVENFKDFQNGNAVAKFNIQNDTNKLEILPNQLLDLLDDQVKKDTKNGTNSNYSYSYYSSEDEK